MDKKEQLTSIVKATTEMQSFFSKKEKEANNRIQAIRQELFELDIRLDEKGRTRSLYAMNASSRKNVFSPIPLDDQNAEKESQLEKSIRELSDRKAVLTEQLNEEQTKLSDIEDKLQLLRKALHATARLSRDPAFTETEDPEDIIEFIEPPEEKADTAGHGERILNLDAFDRTYLTTVLTKKVLQPLEAEGQRMEQLQRLIRNDPHQAALMTGELAGRRKELTRILREQLERVKPTFDESSPIAQSLDRWVMELRDSHPEFVLESSVSVRDETLVLPYIRGLTLYRLLDIFTDNIVQHADATQVRLRIQITAHTIDVFLSDNGRGIRDEDEANAPWYSSLHKAEELLYLLEGHLQITGSANHGTTVRFSIPL